MKKIILFCLIIILINTLVGCGGGSGGGGGITISGRVTKPDGEGLSGIIIYFGCEQDHIDPVTTDANGNWSKSGLNPTTLITPVTGLWTYSPLCYIASGAASDFNFVATEFNFSGKIVFAGYDNSGKGDMDGDVVNSSIYLLTNDKQITKLITFPNQMHQERYSNPCWSPDGSKIVYDDIIDGICVMDSNGTNQIKISNERDGTPNWSKTGNKIVFVWSNGNRVGPQICTMNPDGSSFCNLNIDLFYNYVPEWSPDGTKIVFVKQSSLPSRYDIYTMNADGSNRICLTNKNVYNHYPSWSPDGTKIAFISGDYISRPHIYIMNQDGNNQRIINTGVDDITPYGLSWSPDGTKIIFYGYLGVGGVFVINEDGTGLTRLTGLNIRGYRASWHL